MRLLDISVATVGCGAVFVVGNCLAQGAAQPAGDDARLEEVVVTAERRSIDIQDAATSVSVRTGEELAEQGRYTLQDILRDVPGVAAPDSTITPSLGGSDSRGAGVVIRGIGSGPGGGGPGSPLSGSSTSAVYVDGVYEGIGGDYDLQRVEILRGPQGTLYGRSATSGVMATYTQDPSFDALSGDVSAQFANYTKRRYTGALNVPLGNSFAIRASVNKEEADEGFYSGEGGAYDRIHGRVKALYQATDDLSLLFGFAFEENDANTGGCRGTSPADGVVAYNNCFAVKPAHNDARQYWLSLEWDLGPVTLFYQPALRTYYQRSAVDLNGPFNLPMSQTFETPHDQFVTQELRLASNDDGKFKWQSGLFYYWNDVQTENANRWASSGALLYETPTGRDVKDYGLFGEGTYSFTEATRLTVGVRYDYTRVSTSQAYNFNFNLLCNTPGGTPNCDPTGSGQLGFPELNQVTLVNENTDPSGLRTWKKVNYKLRLEQDLSPQNLLYAMVSTGFIPGDVDVSCGATGCSVLPYDAETLTAYEVGSKNRFLDERLQLNGAAFYYDYGGAISQVQPDNNNPTSTFTLTLPAKTWGVELELLYQLTSRDRFGFNYAFVDSRYVDAPARFASEISWTHRAGLGVPTNDYTAPHTANASYEHVFDLPGNSSLTARIDGTFSSTYRYLNPSNTMLNSPSVGPEMLKYAYMDSGAIGNFNLNWSTADGRFGVGAYVRNFTDHRWISYDVRTLTPERLINATETAPRTYGVTLSARF